MTSQHLLEVIRRAHRHVIEDAGEEQPTVHSIRSCVTRIGPLLTDAEIDDAVERIGQQLFGLGPLEPLLHDPNITEIMVNGPGRVWVEQHGDLGATDVVVDHAMLRVIVERIVAPLGLRVDRTAPFVDARLPDGSRVNIAVAPLALDGPYVTIRRFCAEPHVLRDFCTGDVHGLLAAAVEQRQSLVISGGTGAGKTSLLNALAAHIGPGERVLTIEDAAELRLPGDHVVRLEGRPPNAEGVGEVTIRSLVRNALRMRPDRLIVGEVRGAEALDMIQAMNTGHKGSMSTCHANSPIAALRRLEAMIAMADVDLPIDIIREHVASAVDLIVQVERGTEGRRQIGSVYSCSDQRWLVRDGVRAATHEMSGGPADRRPISWRTP